MKYLFSILSLFFCCSVFGQTITLTSNGDTLHSHLDSLSCRNPCATVVASIYPAALAGTSVYSVSSIPYTPDPFYLGTPATVLGSLMSATYDDNYGDSVAISFPFSFFCNTYNKVIIGTNGNVTFNPLNTNVYDPWPISGPLPGSNCTATEDCIMGPWNDLYPPNGGTIKWAIYGTAPNRRFVVSWDSVHLFISGTCAGFTTEQIVLHETTNIIDIFISSRIPCTAWNSGYAVTGIENLAGTSFYNPPGENGTTFTATNEGWRFTPSAPTPWVTKWYDSTGTTVVSTTDTLTVCPTRSTPYIFKATNLSTCGSTSLIMDTIRFVPVSTVHETFTNPTVCGECNGTIKFTGLDPLVHVSVSYMMNGVTQPLYTGTAGYDSSFTMTGLCAGVYSNIVVTGGSCSAYAPNATLVNPPPFPANFYLTTKLACGGDEVIAYNTSSPGGYNAYWSWGDGTIDSSGAFPDTHQYKDSLLGYVATYTVTLTYESYHNPACATTHDTVISFDHPISAAFTEDNTAVCVGVPVNFTNNSIANGPSYSWDFGDGFTDTVKNPSHAYAAGGDYTVTLVTKDTIGCYSLPATGEVTAVQVDIHVSVADTSVCLTDSMHLHTTATVLPAGEVSYYTYWTPTTNLGEDSSTTPNFFGIGTFTYTVNLATTAPAVCMASDNETVHSYPPVTLTGLTASPTIIPYGSSVMLNADGAVYYTWTPDNGTLSNPSINDPVATPTDTTTIYTVYGTNLYGCLDSAKITVNLDIDRLEDMPTGFTPDGDGLNDVFRITHLKYKKLVEFRVYNRWGQEVFSTANPEIGWDGTYHGVPQDIGVYNYQIIIAESDGTQKVYKGAVTLIR